MALASLSIDIVAKLAALEEGMSKATRIAEKNAAAIEARYARIGSAVKTVAGVIGTAFAGVSLVNFVRGTIDGLDALNDLKDATGASIENLSALEDVAARTGTSFDDVAATLIRFNKVLADAKPGGEMANALKGIGLEAAELKALDPAEALRRVAVALSKYADDGNKARLVQDLFGKSVRQAGPLLNDLAQQTQLVATRTTEQALAAERFNQQLAAMSKNSQDAARSLVGDMLPALNRLLQEFVAGKEAFGGFFGALGNIGTSRTFDNALQGLQHYQRKLADLRQTEREVANAPNLFFGDAERKAAVRDDIANTEKFIRYYERLLQLSNSAGAGRGFGFQGADDRPKVPALSDATRKTPKATEIDEGTRALAQYVGQLERELTVTQDLSEEQQALNFLKSLGTKGEIPQVRELVLRLAAEVDQRHDAAKMTDLQADAIRRLRQAELDRRRDLDSLLENLPTKELERLQKLQQQLDQELSEGKVTPTAYAEAMGVLNASIQRLRDLLKDDPFADFKRQTGQAVSSFVNDSVMATIEGRFNKIDRLFGDMIKRMLAQATSAKLSEVLLGNFANTGNVGGLFGDMFKFFGFHTGGVVGEVPRFHKGGIAGDEVPAVLLKGEEVLTRSDPRHRSNAGSATGPAPAPIVINVDGGMNRNEVFAAMQLMANSLRGEFRQSLRNAGVA